MEYVTTKLEEGGFKVNIVHNDNTRPYPYDDKRPVKTLVEKMKDF